MNQDDLKTRLLELHSRWKEGRKANKGKASRHPTSFQFYIRQHYRQLIVQLMINPRVLHTLPGNVQRDWKGQKPQPIGQKALEELTEQIARRWLADPQGLTLTDFTNSLLERFDDRRDLEEFLAA